MFTETEAVALITGFFTLLAGFLAQAYVAWANRAKEEAARKHEFVLSQVRELYSPLLALIDEMKALDETNRFFLGVSAKKNIFDGPDYERMNERLRTRNQRFYGLLRKAKDLFQEKHYLCEDSTQALFKSFVRGVEQTEQLLDNAVPAGMTNDTIWDRTSIFEDIEKHLSEKREFLKKHSALFKAEKKNWLLGGQETLTAIPKKKTTTEQDTPVP